MTEHIEVVSTLIMQYRHVTYHDRGHHGHYYHEHLQDFT